MPIARPTRKWLVCLGSQPNPSTCKHALTNVMALLLAYLKMMLGSMPWSRNSRRKDKHKDREHTWFQGSALDLKSCRFSEQCVSQSCVSTVGPKSPAWDCHILARLKLLTAFAAQGCTWAMVECSSSMDPFWWMGKLQQKAMLVFMQCSKRSVQSGATRTLVASKRQRLSSG